MVNVIKRNKSVESVKFDKITTRLKKLCKMGANDQRFS